MEQPVTLHIQGPLQVEDDDGSMFSILIPADLMNKPGPWTIHLLFTSMKQPGEVLYTMTFSFNVPQ